MGYPRRFGCAKRERRRWGFVAILANRRFVVTGFERWGFVQYFVGRFRWLKTWFVGGVPMTSKAPSFLLLFSVVFCCCARLSFALYISIWVTVVALLLCSRPGPIS